MADIGITEGGSGTETVTGGTETVTGGAEAVTVGAGTVAGANGGGNGSGGITGRGWTDCWAEGTGIRVGGGC